MFLTFWPLKPYVLIMVFSYKKNDVLNFFDLEFGTVAD